jgi:glycosyltransferase involved in cell wall biosynthesis
LRAVLAKRLLHVPLVITPHGEDIQRIAEIGYGLRLRRSWDKIIKWNLSEADAVTAISDSIKHELSFLPNEKVFDIPNGIDRGKFVPVQCGYLHDLLGFNPEKKIVLTVGRYHMKKGYEYGIKAFELIRNKGYRNLIYVIIGRGSHRLKPLVKSLNLDKKVHLISQLDRETLLKCYQSSWAFFSPSIVEGLSMVSIEAMSTGLPLIVTDVPGNLDIVRDNNCGVIVASKDPRSMAKGILRLLLTEGLYDRYSRRGVERAELYDWKNIALKYIETYRTAIDYRQAI